MENEIVKKNKNLWVKILIVILALVVVAGIYVYKKSEEDKLNNQKTAQMDSENANEESTDEESTNEENSLLEISSVDLDEIKSYGLPFVIDFGSDSCIPCKEMAPVLETLHEEFQGKAIVHFVDVWKNTTAANNFPVSVIPTQVFFTAAGTPYVPSDELAQEIEFTMYRSKDTNKHVFTVHQGGITEVQMRKIFAEMGVE
ncbi:thioredoxin family protein [Clostridium boliviensis]|uniref:Thioredoxin family protein n=1 Tax=Clostridium boliviensis TaxID=318465 RepID=A0ABU4GT68_9CLOT|nr:thioredoxin family protein [Clostridium boliviensis]MDW2800175.1 thioredoxin family protein [Clostridium boliviensis]